MAQFFPDQFTPQKRSTIFIQPKTRQHNPNMFLFMPQIFRHNKFTVEKAEDVLSFRAAPLAQPKKGFRIVCAPFLFHNNDITIRNQKLNDGIQYNSPKYSDSIIGDTCADGFRHSTHSRMMLEGTGHEEELQQTTLKIAEARVNFEKSMDMLYKELILAKNM
ncbi:uncharacterized protein LY89DRAFT_741217 [Mollisia scopiformis]|uniref:Uncharacterized protein n=1 Tax=Mollisia scopiformis TaxID=149040 RepID=A0A132BB62_MOLSC|nr:uncharacterized protein LY89DRAFT_741217 [Mollisia scopiformis]KUJ09513.1 hypothetical protein LY89DRAFT_741217 [Mollisia scopiformis]